MLRWRSSLARRYKIKTERKQDGETDKTMAEARLRSAKMLVENDWGSLEELARAQQAVRYVFPKPKTQMRDKRMRGQSRMGPMGSLEICKTGEPVGPWSSVTAVCHRPCQRFRLIDHGCPSSLDARCFPAFLLPPKCPFSLFTTSKGLIDLDGQQQPQE